MKLTDIYNSINENEDKMISIKYLKQLLNNVTNKSAQKVLIGWIAKGGDAVKLTPKQQALLKVIERGGPSSNFYHNKN